MVVERCGQVERWWWWSWWWQGQQHPAWWPEGTPGHNCWRVLRDLLLSGSGIPLGHLSFQWEWSQLATASICFIDQTWCMEPNAQKMAFVTSFSALVAFTSGQHIEWIRKNFCLHSVKSEILKMARQITKSTWSETLPVYLLTSIHLWANKNYFILPVDMMLKQKKIISSLFSFFIFDSVLGRGWCSFLSWNCICGCQSIIISWG